MGLLFSGVSARVSLSRFRLHCSIAEFFLRETWQHEGHEGFDEGPCHEEHEGHEGCEGPGDKEHEGHEGCEGPCDKEHEGHEGDEGSQGEGYDEEHEGHEGDEGSQAEVHEGHGREADEGHDGHEGCQGRGWQRDPERGRRVFQWCDPETSEMGETPTE